MQEQVQKRLSGERAALLALLVGVLSFFTAVYHLLLHQAPLLPTILGQWLLLVVTAAFLLSTYYVFQQTKTAGEKTSIGFRVCAAYIFGAAVSLSYASHQYFTPVADVGLNVIIFDAVFTASSLGIAGSVIGLKSVQQQRALDEVARQEKEISDEQAFTETILNAVPDVFYGFDQHGDFFEWNDQFSEVTGYSGCEINSLHPTEFVVEEDQAKVMRAISDVFENDETITVEARLQTKDGESIPYEFTGSKITRPDDGSSGLVGVGRDISKLKEQRQRFRAVFNNTFQFIGLMDTEGELLEVNETALTFGGVNREQVVGEKIWETYWFQENDKAQDVAKKAIKRANTGSQHREEITVQGAKNTETIEFSVRPITDSNGETVLLVPEGRVVTNLRQRERHLQVLHRFLRHNLRNKMTVIQGTADVLEQNIQHPEHEKYASQIEGAAEELIELSETAHELSQVVIDDGSEDTSIPLQRVLETIKENITTEYASATIVIDLERDTSVRADWRVENVFSQLIENAVEHSDSGDPTVEIEAEHDRDSVTVHIADDGPGIPSEELTGIITDDEPTQLTHGTGFGLWLARSVVDDYGGNLDYEPHPDGGSIIEVKLPKSDVKQSAPISQSEPSKS